MSLDRYRGAIGLLGIPIGALLAGACGSSSSGAQTTQSTTTTTTTVHAARCTPRGARVLAANHDAVVYTVPRMVQAGPGPGLHRPGVAVFGCRVATGRRAELGTATAVDKIALAGSAVAYSTTAARGVDTIETSVAVADIRGGHRRFEVPAGHIAVAPHFVTVDALAVTPGGTVAWIQHGGTLEPPGYSVHAASVAKPSDHLLGLGPRVDPRSLSVTGSLVSWVAGGQHRLGQI